MPLKKKRTDSKKLASINKKKKKVAKQKKFLKKKVEVAKEVTVSREKESELKKKPGSSNSGEYEDVSPTNFSGTAGGASPYSFPIDTLKRARSALARAHFASDPEGIERSVYRKWPELNPKNKKK